MKDNKLKVSVFLPVRKGTKRVIDKNTKTFAGIEGGLLAIKLLQLSKCKDIDEVVISTNCDKCWTIGEQYVNKFPKLFKLDRRPEKLCSDELVHSDLIDHIEKVTTGQIIMLTHCTSPLVTQVDYSKAVLTYYEALFDGYDSLATVREHRNFLFDSNGNMINNSTSHKWPRTQDLDVLHEINSALFITSRAIYKNLHDRVGRKFYPYIMDNIKSIDVDWEADFFIAEAVYTKLYGGN